MNELIKFFSERGLLLPIQAIIIIANIYLLTKDKCNNYLLLSLILILSTVVLQAVRRRFLLLYPFNFPMGRPSVHVDTYYLRIVLITSMLFMIFGVCQAYYSYFIDLNEWLKVAIPYSIVGFIIVFPLLFMLTSERINELIANKIKEKGPNLSISDCPFCLSRSSIQENNIIDKNRISVKTNCLKCGKKSEYEITTNIGD